MWREFLEGAAAGTAASPWVRACVTYRTRVVLLGSVRGRAVARVARCARTLSTCAVPAPRGEALTLWRAGEALTLWRVRS